MAKRKQKSLSDRLGEVAEDLAYNLDTLNDLIAELEMKTETEQEDE